VVVKTLSLAQITPRLSLSPSTITKNSKSQKKRYPSYY